MSDDLTREEEWDLYHQAAAVLRETQELVEELRELFLKQKKGVEQ